MSQENVELVQSAFDAYFRRDEPGNTVQRYYQAFYRLFHAPEFDDLILDNENLKLHVGLIKFVSIYGSNS